MELDFQPDGCTVTAAGQTVRLLPKEYALLACLVQHTGRSLTRDELLDLVWPREEPVDRTVDDHIYRLRKKTAVWRDRLQIETIRGRGYRLTIKQGGAPEYASQRDPEFVAQFQSLFRKYHLFGQGAAMQMLSDQRDLLGAAPDPFYEMYVRFISGDYEWIVRTEEVPFWERAYFILNVTRTYAEDKEAVYQLFQRVLAAGRLPEFNQWETERLDIATLLMKTGREEQAVRCLEETRDMILQDPSLNGVQLAVWIKLIAAYLAAGDDAAAERQIMDAAALLSETPYLRERGYFHLYRGIWQVRHGRVIPGREDVAEAMRLLEESKFVPQYHQAMTILLFFLRKYVPDTAMTRKYERRWQEILRGVPVDSLLLEIEHLFARHL